MDRSAGSARDVGTGDREILERRGVVFLSFLAAEIFVQRAGIRRESCGALRVDTVCGGGSGLPAGRMVFEPPGEAKSFARNGAEIGAGVERRGDAGGDFDSERAGVVGD